MNNILNRLNRLRLVSVNCSNCKTFKSVQLPYRWKTTSVRLPSQHIVISNLCDKLKCTEIIAKNIYDKCPELRSIDAIQNDSLQMLSKKLSSLSIIEHPELVTIDLDTLKRKIKLLFDSAKPKNLDDFAPLLLMKEQELKNFVCKRMLNEQHDVGEHGNRIYYISDKLQVVSNIFAARIQNIYKFLFGVYLSVGRTKSGITKYIEMWL